MSIVKNVNKTIVSSSLGAAVGATATALLVFGAGVAQAAPFDGNPDVWIDPGVTSLTVHVRSWSPHNANCLYTADWYNRPFDLGAFSTRNIVISPSIPEFRDWNVAVNCDDGTGTQFTYFY